MPRYSFVCAECRKQFEQTLHMDEVASAKLKCPDCGSEKIEQEFSAFSAVTGNKSTSTSAGGRWR
jgi:putative FmdB family regulatory protein